MLLEKYVSKSKALAFWLSANAIGKWENPEKEPEHSTANVSQ